MNSIKSPDTILSFLFSKARCSQLHKSLVKVTVQSKASQFVIEIRPKKIVEKDKKPLDSKTELNGKDNKLDTRSQRKIDKVNKVADTK